MSFVNAGHIRRGARIAKIGVVEQIKHIDSQSNEFFIIGERGRVRCTNEDMIELVEDLQISA